MYICIYVNVCVCVWAYMCAWLYVCVCVCVCVCVFVGDIAIIIIDNSYYCKRYLSDWIWYVSRLTTVAS